MRKVLSIAGAAMIASSVLVAPTYAQSGGSGGGGGGQGGSQGNNPSETSTGAPGGGGLPSQGGQSGQSGQGSQQGGSGGTSGAGGGGGQQGTGGGQGGQTGGGQGGGGQMGGGQMGGGMMGSGQAGGPMTASGSCGMDAGMYGMNNVMPDEGFELADTLFFRIDYSGLPAPTTVGVIVRFNDELEDQRSVQTFTAMNSGGTFEGRLTSGAANPGGQGGNNVDPLRASAGISNSRGNRDSDGRSTAQVRNGGGTSNTSTGGGGIQAGDYHFYVYTGEIKDMPETVKDGPTGPRFFADQKGFLGKFSCGVGDTSG